MKFHSKILMTTWCKKKKEKSFSKILNKTVEISIHCRYLLKIATNNLSFHKYRLNNLRTLNVGKLNGFNTVFCLAH